MDPEIAPVAQHFNDQLETLEAASRKGRILDLACGRGRHALTAARRGLPVLAIDRNEESLETLRRAAPEDNPPETRVVDLETDAPPTLAGERFGAILVFRYLHRPICEWIVEQLAPGGLLVYETFTTRQRALGWGPKRDAFLLEPGELPGLFPGLDLVHFEEGPSRDEPAAETARLVARKPA